MKTIELTAWFEPSLLVDSIFTYIKEQEDIELLRQITVELSTELQCWDEQNDQINKMKQCLVKTLSD